MLLPMKRTNLKKLKLDTTTLRPLDNRLNEVVGGIARTVVNGCSSSCTNPTASICWCTQYCGSDD